MYTIQKKDLFTGIIGDDVLNDMSKVILTDGLLYSQRCSGISRQFPRGRDKVNIIVFLHIPKSNCYSKDQCTCVRLRETMKL